MASPYSRPAISIYHDAPDKLLEKIGEINDILVKYKAKTSNSETIKFWEGVSEVMLFSYKYMLDIEWILKRNTFLESENHHLKQWTGELMRRLDQYETIREAINDGSLAEITKVVEKAISKESGS